MDLTRPGVLWLLAGLPLLLLWSLRGRRRRRAAWWTLGHNGDPPPDAPWAGLVLLGLLILAMAGPRWGRLPGSAPPPGHDVVLLVDVSRSMAAEDAVPNRLGLAVEAAEVLVAAIGQERGGRVAVVAFAGRGVPRCPLTENLGAAVDVLRGLKPGEVLPAGSNLGSGLAAALEAFDADTHPEPEEGRTIVVLGDGEDHEASWQSLLPALIRAKIQVHAIAIGDAENLHPIPIHDPERPGTMLSWRGETVQTRRRDDALRAIARATEGAFVPLGLSPPAGLAMLYRERIAPLARRTRALSRTPERVDRYRLVILAALAVGALGSWPAWKRLTWIALFAVVCLPGAAQHTEDAGSSPRDESSTLDTDARRLDVSTVSRRGEELYARGELEAALTAFERAAVLAPDSPLPRFNAAACLFALGRYEEAAKSYSEAYDRADQSLRLKIDYALGNTSVALGDFDAAIRHYDACLDSPLRGTHHDATRRDAAINRAFAERYRAMVQEQPRSPQQGSEPDPDNAADGEPSPDPESSRDDGEREPSRDRGQESRPDEAPGGAAATAGPSADTVPEGTPRERLDRAIENIRRAKEARISDPLPPPDLDVERKPW